MEYIFKYEKWGNYENVFLKLCWRWNQAYGSLDKCCRASIKVNIFGYFYFFYTIIFRKVMNVNTRFKFRSPLIHSTSISNNFKLFLKILIFIKLIIIQKVILNFYIKFKISYSYELQWHLPFLPTVRNREGYYIY